MAVFQFFSLVAALATMGLVIHTLRYQRFLFVKPSIWFLLAFHIIIQWSSVVYSSVVFSFLDEPYIFFLLTHLVPFVSILIVKNIQLSLARRLWARFGESRRSIEANRDFVSRIAIFTLVVCVSVVAIYLLFVPFTSTGFYMNMSNADPYLAELARENSSKLLKFTWLKYLYSYFQNFISAFCVSILSVLIILNFEKQRIFKAVFLFLLALMVIVGAMLPGARASGVSALFIMVATVAMYGGARIKPMKAAVMVCIIILPAVVTQMVKYNQVGFDSFVVAMGELLLRRTLRIPMETGLYWVGYVEDFGFWGVSGISKLASLLGVESEHVQSFMFRYQYNPSADSTGYMNTSFVFSYYSYFGLFSIPLCIGLIVSLDSWLYIYNNIHESILINSVVVLNASCLYLLSSEFTTLLITYGFVSGLIYILPVSNYSKTWFRKRRFRTIRQKLVR